MSFAPDRRSAPAVSLEQDLLELALAATAGTPPGKPPAPPAAAGAEGEPPSRLDQFLAEPSPGRAIAMWIGAEPQAETRSDRDALARRLNAACARIDTLLSDQLNAVLHHPALQRLEASWRGLHFLVSQLEETENIKIRLLNVSWKEIGRDLERAIEFDQSQLFRKVYSEEFDTPGGEPFSVLIGDYYAHPRPSAKHPIDDVAVLRGISQVAAAAFAPFVAAADPSMFEMDEFAELEKAPNLARNFTFTEYLPWRSLRDSEDSRFLGLALPRILMRPPYEDDGSRHERFGFRETTARRSGYLWGNPAYAFAAVLMRAFSESGWLADIHGVRRGEISGGVVPALPSPSVPTDARGLVPKGSTEVAVTDAQEQEISDLGFIPLCRCKDTEFTAFYTNQSVQKPKQYDSASATMNARISAMLQYMLCVSRFAHYLKVAARDKIGSFSEAEELQDYLHRWIQQYVTSDSEAQPHVKAEYPLREARIEVTPHPGKPGAYLCTAHLWPHFELDELVTSIRVRTELTPGPAAG